MGFKNNSGRVSLILDFFGERNEPLRIIISVSSCHHFRARMLGETLSRNEAEAIASRVVSCYTARIRIGERLKKVKKKKKKKRMENSRVNIEADERQQVPRTHTHRERTDLWLAGLLYSSSYKNMEVELTLGARPTLHHPPHLGFCYRPELRCNTLRFSSVPRPECISS